MSMHKPHYSFSFVCLLIVLVSSSWALRANAGWPTSDSQGQTLPTLAPLLKKINPAVVNISVVQTRQAYSPLMNDPFFRRFFNVPKDFKQRERKTQSAGSGVIINAAQGTVITNHHVIANADKIQVHLKDGRQIEAELVGSDPEVDIAVLKIKAKNLAALTLADSKKLEVGDFVVAIGNPFGLGQTVTTGIVSALGRSGLGIEGYENFIQTDASINPGNSGGALVNLRGELVGINTAIVAPGGSRSGSVGIGFAIPSNMAKISLDQILKHGEVKRGRLGVFIQDLTPELAEAFDLDKHQRGVLISKVQEGSAAESAGIKEGDIVTEVNGDAVNQAGQLRNAVGMRRIGDKLKLTLLRDGREKTIKVKIGGNIDAEIASNDSAQTFKRLEGTQFKDNPDGEGVMVSSIEPGSIIAHSGLQVGDVIVQANRQNIRNLDDLKKAIKRGGDKLLLRINRDGIALYVAIR